jgi:DNA invertase Pin-like site-specific DNA recombinase
LKVYLDLVRKKQIEPGTVLVIEHFDRLSGEVVIRIVLPLLLDLINAGIIVATYLDQSVYDQEIMSGPLGPMMLTNSIMLMSMANAASQEKSDRRKNTNRTARKAAPATGIHVNGLMPRWIKKKNGKPTPPWVDVGHPQYWWD